MIKRQYLIFVCSLVLIAIVFRYIVVDNPGANVKSFFIPAATIFVDTFNSSSTALFLSLAMAISGLYMFLYFWLAILKPVKENLIQINKSLKGVVVPIDDEGLRQIDIIMRRYDIIAKDWTLFRSRVVRGDDGQFRSLSRIGEYVNITILERSGIKIRLFMGLPNDFVGIGLIFTFMGLVAGLYFASRSMMSDDIGASRDALIKLLHAATFKFMTSITGIGVSLVLSWSQRILLGNIEEELTEIQYLVEKCIPYGKDRFSQELIPPTFLQPPDKIHSDTAE